MRSEEGGVTSMDQDEIGNCVSVSFLMGESLQIVIFFNGGGTDKKSDGIVICVWLETGGDVRVCREKFA